MSAYTAIARYLFSEASSGTTPTTIADSVGSNTLTINYQTNKAAWASVGAGKGLDFTATGGSATSAYARCAATTGNIGSAFSGKTEVSSIIAFRADAVPNEAVLFNITDDRGSFDGSFALWLMALTSGQLQIRVCIGSEDAAGDTQFQRATWFESSQTAYTASAICVLHVVVDTTQAVVDNRVKLWLNGAALTASDENFVTQNTAISTLTANDWLYTGNSPALNQNLDGAIFYLEVGTGQLTAPQIASTYAALIANNDANAFSVVASAASQRRRRQRIAGIGAI